METKHNVSIEDRFGNRGTEVYKPVTEKEISDFLKKANEEGKSVSIEGGGTKRGYGGQGEAYDWTLSLADWKGVVEHQAGDMTVTVRAGTTIAELQTFLEDYDQKVSIDPCWPDDSTIGGVISANESGPKRMNYGSARDLVIGLRVVYPDGEVIRTGAKVVKNVAGYDMNKLFIGAMGTLGVISEITMKLRPKPKYESLVLLSVEEEEVDTLRSLAVSIQDAMIEPVCLELMNPQLSKYLTGREAYTLLVGFEDVEKAVKDQEGWMEYHKPASAQMDVKQEEDAREFWKAFSKRAPNALDQSDGETKVVLKTGSKPMEAFSIIKEAEKIQHEVSVQVESHGGLGHGISQLVVSGSEEGIVSFVDQLRKYAAKQKGYVILKHLPTELRKSIDPWGNYTSGLFLMEKIKKAVDPDHTLNHQRFIGGI
ncbi:FAD-binding oxidoreductase [Halobacillus litoralis]|uniref:FAD-binding oxidoreductase n=1 Tax=Halobacillus litoralis TaxID=45668 RepID=UPI001CFC7EE7|nr:FAD-binding oxidoreductase [Halobacillus litoralis]